MFHSSHRILGMTAILCGLGVMLTGCQPTSQESMSTPEPASAKPSSMLVQGQQLFESSCVGCHSLTGHGNKMMSPSMPDFADAHWQNRITDQAMIQTIQTGKGSMPPFDNQFKPAELKALVAYIRHFAEGAR